MNQYKIKPVGKDKVNITRQVSQRLYGVSWRIGTSTTVTNDVEAIGVGKAYVDDYINKRLGWSLSQLVDAYPKQYRKALNRTTGQKATLTYSHAVKELVPYLRERVSSNTLYNRISALKRYGTDFNLNNMDVTLLTAQEVNRILTKKHESLGSKSHATFDTSLASFRWLFKYLKAKDYIDTDHLAEFKIVRPEIVTNKNESDDRKFYTKSELDFIYECLDDNRHLIVDNDYFIKLRSDIRAGKIKDDHQFYKAHYKVRRVLQLMMDCGLRSGEVAALRKLNLQGVVSLDKPIDFSSTLWHDLDVLHETLIYEEPYQSILNTYELDSINMENLIEVYPQSLRLSYAEKIKFMNTMKFLYLFSDPKLQYWKDFKWRRWMNGDRHVSSRRPKDLGISNILNKDKDIFWIADAVPDFYADVIVESTVTKDVDSVGRVFIRAKKGAKTDSGSNRIVPLDKRARDTIVKVWRDIVALEQSNTDEIDYLFLNEDMELYDPSSITNAWTKLNHKMLKIKPDLPILSPHKLRHSHITIKARQTTTMGDLLKLRDEVGHKHLSTTLDVYVQREKGYSDPGKSGI